MKTFPFKRSFLFQLLGIVLLLSVWSACTRAETGCKDDSQINEEQICAYIYMPVCGCDGKTYGNSCIADGAGVTSYTTGRCND